MAGGGVLLPAPAGGEFPAVTLPAAREEPRAGEDPPVGAAVSGGRRVAGGARLTYESTPSGPTVLRRQWVRPPLHLGKTYHDRGWALHQWATPTAGLLAGDSLAMEVELGRGAHAALLSPAACRVHRMGPDEVATLRQHYRVGPEGALEVWPAPLVLQAGAACVQDTVLSVDGSAALLWIEVVAPGRSRYGGGESFAFREWKSRFRLERDGQLVALERFRVRPEGGEPADWRARFPEGSYASLYCLGAAPAEEGSLVERLHALAGEDLRVGASPLEGGGLGVKLLGRDPLALRRGIAMARGLLRGGLQWPVLSSLERAQTYFS